MDKKQNNKICNGYESNYMFLSDEDFQKHLEECESCRKEHERMQKVSDLLKEAKPYIKAKRKKNQILKAACALALLCFTSLSVPIREPASTSIRSSARVSKSKQDRLLQTARRRRTGRFRSERMHWSAL